MVFIAEVWEIYIWGDCRTEHWGVCEREEEPLFSGVYAKKAEVGNGAVR